MDRKSTSSSLAIPTLLIGLVAVAGSLWLSLGMGLKACPLCLYQRSFVIGAVVVLIMGACLARRPGFDSSGLSLLALPMSAAALFVATFHVYLEFSGKLECPAGIFGVGTAPQQSLAILLILNAALGLQAFQRAGDQRRAWFPALLAILLGGLMAYGSIVSAPPLPKPPTSAYETPLDTCRPPFRNS